MNLQEIHQTIANTPDFKEITHFHLDTSNPLIEESLSHFKSTFFTLTQNELVNKHLQIIQVFNRLPIIDFIVLFNYLDSKFPGLSFYYILEAFNTEHIEYFFFIQRIKNMQNNNLLGTILSILRQRLVSGLLSNVSNEPNNTSQNIIDSITQTITNSFHVSEEDILDIQTKISSLPLKTEIPQLNHIETIKILSLSRVPQLTIIE